MKTKTLHLTPEQTIDYIVARIQGNFRTFGGGVSNDFNPLSVALKDAPAQFAACVDVREVVEFIIKELE